MTSGETPCQFGDSHIRSTSAHSSVFHSRVVTMVVIARLLLRSGVVPTPQATVFPCGKTGKETLLVFFCGETTLLASAKYTLTSIIKKSEETSDDRVVLALEAEGRMSP